MKIWEIKIGEIIYRLGNPIYGEYNSHTGIFRTDDLPNIWGVGDTAEDAIEDFELYFHERFQKLHHREDFDIPDDSQLEEKKQLETVVDTEHHYFNNYSVYRRLGTIIRAEPGKPRLIQWGDDTFELIPLERGPRDFCDYKEGKTLRLTIETKPTADSKENIEQARDNGITRILHIERLPEPESIID